MPISKTFAKPIAMVKRRTTHQKMYRNVGRAMVVFSVQKGRDIVLNASVSEAVNIYDWKVAAMLHITMKVKSRRKVSLTIGQKYKTAKKQIATISLISAKHFAKIAMVIIATAEKVLVACSSHLSPVNLVCSQPRVIRVTCSIVFAMGTRKNV